MAHMGQGHPKAEVRILKFQLLEKFFVWIKDVPVYDTYALYA